MVLFATVFVFAVLGLGESTNLPRVYQRRPPRPVRGQIGLLGPGPLPRLPSRIPPRLPPSNRVVWVKKIDPRTGAWVKVISKKRDAISPVVRHHFAKKAHYAQKRRVMESMIRARNLRRMNTVRGGLLGFARRHGNRKVVPKSRPLRPMYPRAGIAGILGQTRRPGPVNFPRHSRRQLLRGNSNLRRRFDDDDDIFDDFDDTFDDIDDSFDDRFDRGFRDTIPLLNRRSSLVGAGIRGFQRSIPQTPTQMLNRGLRNPSVRADVLELSQKAGYYPRDESSRRTVNTVGIGGTQTGSFKPLGKLKNSINAAVLGTFDRKRNIPFRGMAGTGVAGVLGNQRTSARALPRVVNKAVSLNNRIFDSVAGIPIPSRGIGIRNTGVAGIASVEQFPDGLLDDDDDFEDLSDTFGHRIDLVNDELRHLNDRIDLSDHLNMKNRLDFNDRVDNLNDRFENRVSPSVPVDDGFDVEILDRPHMVTAIGGRDGDDIEGDIGLLGQDRSPIDGLELLGPSSWRDIMTELQNAAINPLFDQIPQESVPVFPVNPHSKADSITPNDGTSNRNNGLRDGSLALLGIDPSTIKTASGHPPPIPLPKESKAVAKQNSLDSQTTTKKITITGNDDSSQTVITFDSPKNGNPATSAQSAVDQSQRAPANDIMSAARELATLGALDDLDFGLDSFDEDLRV